MSIKSSPGYLPPIPFAPVPLTPLPEVLALPFALGWVMWDAAVTSLDKAPS